MEPELAYFSFIHKMLCTKMFGKTNDQLYCHRNAKYGNKTTDKLYGNTCVELMQ